MRSDWPKGKWAVCGWHCWQFICFDCRLKCRYFGRMMVVFGPKSRKPKGRDE